jgi:hypothetical protein
MSTIIKTISFLVCFLFLSCTDNRREKMLDAREQALSEKEKQFSSKQQDYESLLRLRDSLKAARRTDTLSTRWPETIKGMWSSKLVCTASGCGEYVIGDQKTNEIWHFTDDSARTRVAILNGQKLVRVYSGTYDSAAIRLHFKTDSTAKRPFEMNVSLDNISAAGMTGTQTITFDTSCTAKFSVQLSRILNK